MRNPDEIAEVRAPFGAEAANVIDRTAVVDGSVVVVEVKAASKQSTTASEATWDPMNWWATET